jgi:gamma-glutamyltranspeptidase/glutathione hydrolase
MKALCLFLLAIITVTTMAQDRPTGKSFSTRSEILATNGIAATSQPLATQTAIDILKAGGNAIDAAIAANAVLGLVEPMSCGIGGDLFAIVWSAEDKKLYGLNASGRSPAGLTVETLREIASDEIPIRGVLPVSVPGCVDGWFELHNKFGKIDMKDILKPAINYALNGFPVSEIIADSWKYAEGLKKYPGFKSTYLVNGNAPRKGEIFTNPDLAESYRLIAENGRDEFYKGSIARTIDKFMNDNEGYLSYDDLASHYSEWVEPVSTNYRGYDVWELPPNGQGIAALQMLNILEQHNIGELGFGSEEYLHLLIEAKKLAYEDRARYYADPAFNDIPVKELISKKYAEDRAGMIDKKRAASRYSAGKLDHGDTIYLTVADKDGNMVSLIQSVFWGFGSAVVPDGLGFALQNRGNLFTFEKGHFNIYEPGKRPFHTIIPAFVTKDGKPFMSFGVMGGAMQPQGHVQVLVNIIDFGMNLQEAGDAPRIRHTGSSQPTGSVMNDGGKVYFETGFSEETIRNLTRIGHTLQYEVGVFGGYQAIMLNENGVYTGASESRKDGQAAGY